MADKISKMRRVSSQISEELGREPTDDESAEEIGISRGKVSQLKTASIRPASLDAPIRDLASSSGFDPTPTCQTSRMIERHIVVGKMLEENIMGLGKSDRCRPTNSRGSTDNQYDFSCK